MHGPGGPVMLRAGIDARLWAFIPLSTLFAALVTAFLIAMIGIFAAPRSVLPAFVMIGVNAIWMAVVAWPATLPAALVVWSGANWLLRPRIAEELHVAMIAGGLAGAAGAAAFAVYMAEDAAPGLFVVILPGVVLGAVLAAAVVYRRTAA